MIFAQNRKARFEYHIIEEFEAGLVLRGSEVKSIRARNVSLQEAFCSFEGEELFLVQCHIKPFAQRHPYEKVDAVRSRKLLLHRRELKRLQGRVSERGLTLIPLSIYAKSGKIKLKFGLCRGKRGYDKRAATKKREMDREAQRAMRR